MEQIESLKKAFLLFLCNVQNYSVGTSSLKAPKTKQRNLKSPSPPEPLGVQIKSINIKTFCGLRVNVVFFCNL